MKEPKARDVLKKSLIRESEAKDNVCVRMLQTIDIFSFIPVPKTSTVSTKCSMAGSFIFFALFIGYVTYDLVQFIRINPPLPNTFNEDLPQINYTNPRFALTFMNGSFLEISVDTPPFFNYRLEQSTKMRKAENKTPVVMSVCQPDWLDADTVSNYTQLYCPTKQMLVGGLLYSSSVATNPKITISECVNGSGVVCMTQEDIQSLEGKGRIFLFIEQPTSEYDNIKRANYLIYNFFLVHLTYSRINIQLQVNKEIIMPDYLTRFTPKEATRLEIVSVTELNSFVANNPNSQQLLMSIEFTLAPSMRVTKINYSTLIDHVSQWGALWGVEFTIFAVIFLAYNRKKFYEKNPKWSRFDEEAEEALQMKSVDRE